LSKVSCGCTQSQSGDTNGITPAKVSAYLDNSSSKPLSSLQHKFSKKNDMLDNFWDNELAKQSYIEDVINAAAREEDLEALIEELQLERAQNRGTALLCKNNFQNCKGEGSSQRFQKAEFISNEDSEANVHWSSSTCDKSTLDGTCSTIVSGVKFLLKQHETKTRATVFIQRRLALRIKS
jgi:predicted transcriptional regulator